MASQSRRNGRLFAVPPAVVWSLLPLLTDANVPPEPVATNVGALLVWAPPPNTKGRLYSKKASK